MKPALYNPSSDSISAKIWECLRRNKLFKELVSEQRSLGKRGRARAWQQAKSNARNLFARIALEYLLPTAVKCDHATMAKPDLGLETIWPQMPTAFHSDFDKAFHGFTRHSFLVKQPPFDELEGGYLWSSWTNSKQVLDSWFYGAQDTWGGYDVIAVPKLIRDSAHRNEVLMEVDKLVRRSLLKARNLKPLGRLLGSKAEWGAYLVKQHWRNMGLEEKRARAVTSCHFYEKSYFENWSEDRILNEPKAHRDAKQVDDKRGLQIEVYTAAIDRAIDQVYPRFEALKVGDRGETIAARWDKNRMYFEVSP